MDFDTATDRPDFTAIAGLTLADLTVGEDAAGDALIGWDAPGREISDILIALRGVTAAEVTAGLFVLA